MNVLTDIEAGCDAVDHAGLSQQSALLLAGTIPERFERVVAAQGKHPAFFEKERVWSFDELNAAANRLAHALLVERGTGSEPIALLATHGRSVVIGLLAIMKAGKIVAALPPGNPPVRLARMIKGMGAPLVLADTPHAPLAHEATGSYATVMLMDSHVEAGDSQNPLEPLSPEDPAWILHTSGSTGEPKGVVQSHRNMLHGIAVHTERLGITPRDRLSHLLPCSVIGGLREILLPLLNGASLHPRDIKTQGLAGFATWITLEGITVCRFISSVFRSFAGILDGSEDLSSLRVVYVGGESLTRDDGVLFQRCFPRNCRLVNVIGATETGIFCHFDLDHDHRLTGERVPVGHPVHGMKVRLLDEIGAEVAPGEIGEITVTSRYLSLGYWNRPDLGAEVFRREAGAADERTYRTGDLGRFLVDGSLECLGRRDSQVSINGFRVELDEVESALHRLAAVREGAVATNRSASGSLRLLAYVAPRDGQELMEDDLRHQLADLLPHYMVPARIVVLPELPRTASGKIDRRNLPDPPEEARRSSAPRTRTERQLAAIWERCLERAPVGRDDDFFSLGGTSLHAVQIIAHVEKEFDRQLRPAAVLQSPTVAALAHLLDGGADKPRWSNLVPLREKGSRPPFFWVHGDHSFGTLPRHLSPDQPIYGLEHQGQHGKRAHFHTVPKIAAHYLAQIRTVAPQGPYFIGGYSFGGTVAFEIARQLRAAGEDVALLFLLDSQFPGGPAERTGVMRLLQHAKRLLRHGRALIPRNPDQFRCLRALLVGRPVPAELRSSYIQKIYGRALADYRPHTFDGDVLYIKSTSRPNKNQEQWHAVTDGSFTLHEFPGDHDAMRREDTVALWGKPLDKALAAKTCRPSG